MVHRVPVTPRALLTAWGGLAGCLLLTGCGGHPHPAEQAGEATGRPTGGATVTSEATFAAYSPGAHAVSYDPRLVPPGSTGKVVLTRDAARTQITLELTGLVPDRTYGAHLHANRCGPDPKAAGPHYQHSPDPATSGTSTDPRFANPRNEVWLDFTSDARGAGRAQSTQDWVAGQRAPRSLVIHAARTQTAPGSAGQAGPRLACLDLAE